MPTTINAPASDIPINRCYKLVQTDAEHTDIRTSCSTTLYNDMVKGDWGVVMPYETGISYPDNTCTGNTCYKEVRGISACVPDSFTGAAYGIMAPASLSSVLQTAYENGKTGATPSGARCYCKTTNPSIGVNTTVSPWVFFEAKGSAVSCALNCAGNCASNVQSIASFRGTVFGAVDPTTANE